MKILNILMIIALASMFFWHMNEVNTMANEIQSQRDSIENYHFKKIPLLERYRMYDTLLKKINEPQYLDLTNNDSIIESHRIMRNIGFKALIFKIECLKDSTIRLSFKKGTMKNPITGEGIDSLYDTQVKLLDRKIWNKFKESFNKIDIYDVTYWDGMLDCFGGDLTWEANINHRTYRFGTYCHQAAQFTDVCEIIMRQVKDEELQRKFKEQDKMRQN